MEPRWTHPELAREPVAWLGTADADGAAALVPTWFAWTGEAFLIASKPGARKVRNARANPQVMLGIASLGVEMRAQLIEGVAEVMAEPSAVILAAVDLSKYDALLDADGLDRQTFFERYPAVIRIRPTRFLPWQGPALARAPGQPMPSSSAGRGTRSRRATGRRVTSRGLERGGLPERAAAARFTASAAVGGYASPSSIGTRTPRSRATSTARS